MTYNIILERSWIHNMETILSILHQVVKFPSKWGLKLIKRDRRVAREINSVAIAKGLAKDEYAK